MRFHEIPRDSTSIVDRTTLIKFHLNSHLPISQMTPPTSSSNTIILNKPEDWEQWLWQLQALVDKELWAHVDPTKEAPQQGLLQKPLIQKSQISMRTQPHTQSCRRISRKRTTTADDTTTRT